MRITDDDCDDFRQLYQQNEGISLSMDEARELLSRLCFLFEQFAGWLAKEKAAGRISERGELLPGHHDHNPHQTGRL